MEFKNLKNLVEFLYLPFSTLIISLENPLKGYDDLLMKYGKPLPQKLEFYPESIKKAFLEYKRRIKKIKKTISTALLISTAFFLLNETKPHIPNLFDFLKKEKIEQKILNTQIPQDIKFKNLEKRTGEVEKYKKIANFVPYNGFKEEILKDIPIILKTIKKLKLKYCYVPSPLVILGIEKKESTFNSMAISRAGAAGKMQLMPLTAWQMGLKVYLPDYYLDAIVDYKRSIRLKKKAREFNNADSVKFYLKKSEELKEKAQNQLRLYSKDLKEKIGQMGEREIKKFDERFDDKKAIPAAIKYLAEKLEKNRGDIKKALYEYLNGNLERYKKNFYINNILSFVEYWEKELKIEN